VVTRRHLRQPSLPGHRVHRRSDVVRPGPRPRAAPAPMSALQAWRKATPASPPDCCAETLSKERITERQPDAGWNRGTHRYGRRNATSTGQRAASSTCVRWVD